MTKLFPGCKINLGLKITGKRADGYHEIQSIFLPLSEPHDELIIENNDQDGLKLECSHAQLENDANIVCRAYMLFREKIGAAPALNIFLRKNIPMGAGLGGGSSDAAALLLYLNQYNRKPLEHAKLMELALSIGADVPFFLCGKAALVEGIGEIVQPVENDWNNMHVVLVWPQIHIDTAWAYKTYDRMLVEASESFKNSSEKKPKILTKSHNQTTNFVPCAGICGKSNNKMISWRNLGNDLEMPIFAQWPQLAEIKNNFYGLGAAYASMSGSGSAIYGLFDDLPQAECAAEAMGRQYSHVFLTHL